MKSLDCLKPWCGVDGKFCIDCQGTAAPTGYQRAVGASPVPPGTELPEVTIRRMRGGCEDDIAAAEQRGYAAGQAAQREADAAICDQKAEALSKVRHAGHDSAIKYGAAQGQAEACAAAIRAANLPAPADGDPRP